MCCDLPDNKKNENGLRRTQISIFGLAKYILTKHVKNKMDGALTLQKKRRKQVLLSCRSNTQHANADDGFKGHCIC